MRVAIEAGAAARDDIARLLPDRVVVGTRESAEIVIRDVAPPDDMPIASAHGFSVPTILLVADPHAAVALAAVRAGAAAVLSRQADARELAAALDAVAAGLVVLDAAVRDTPQPVAVGAPGAPAVETLTERERGVLAMLANGLSNRRIAERLAISENTVKAHVASILAKLGAASRTEAVTLGVRLGLVML